MQGFLAPSHPNGNMQFPLVGRSQPDLSLTDSLVCGRCNSVSGRRTLASRENNGFIACCRGQLQEAINDMHHLPRFDTVGSAGQDADEWDAIRGPPPRTCWSTWPSIGSGDVRRCPPCRSASSGTSGRSSAAMPAPAAWRTTDFSRPVTPRPSTTPADARTSASCFPTPCISTARPGIARPATPRLRGLRPGLPRRGRGREPDQAAPPIGQGVVPRLPRLRDRPPPGAVAKHQAEPPHPRDREHRLRPERQPAGPPPQGDVPASRSPVTGEVRAAQRQEECAGLLDETATIGTREGWAERLRATGYALRGHRLVRNRTGD